MAEKLNPEAANPSEIEQTAEAKAIVGESRLEETKEVTELNEYFDDGKHLERLGNIADENAIWVYFGVGGPA